MGFSSKNTRMGCHFLLQGPLGYAKYKLGLAKSICQQLNDHRGICHLPVRLQVAELWHPVREFRVENEALWAPGNRSLDCCHCSVSKSCLTLCNPMDYSSPAYPVFHYLQELAQTHVHWVSDAIQPSHLMSFPSPPALNFPSIRVFLFVCLFVLTKSQLFTSGGQSIGALASVLPMDIQDWFPLGLTGLISLLSKGLSRVFSNTIGL